MGSIGALGKSVESPAKLRGTSAGGSSIRTVDGSSDARAYVAVDDGSRCAVAYGSDATNQYRHSRRWHHHHRWRR